MGDSTEYLDVLGAACALVAQGSVRVWHGTRSDGLAVCVVRDVSGFYLVTLSRDGATAASGADFRSNEAEALLRAADTCAANYAAVCARHGVSL
jgi:hypothetical protein